MANLTPPQAIVAEPAPAANPALEALQPDKLVLIAAFRLLGIERIAVAYSGEGGSCGIDSTDAFNPAGEQVEFTGTVLERSTRRQIPIDDALWTYLWRALDALHPEFDEGPGGHGTMEFFVNSKEVTLHHAAYPAEPTWTYSEI